MCPVQTESHRHCRLQLLYEYDATILICKLSLLQHVYEHGADGLTIRVL